MGPSSQRWRARLRVLERARPERTWLRRFYPSPSSSGSRHVIAARLRSIPQPGHARRNRSRTSPRDPSLHDHLLRARRQSTLGCSTRHVRAESSPKSLSVAAYAAGWPQISLASLVLLFGVFALADGIANVATAVGGRDEHESWWVLLLAGLAGIGVGIRTFFNPGATALGLLFYIAIWAVATCGPSWHVAGGGGMREARPPPG